MWKIQPPKFHLPFNKGVWNFSVDKSSCRMAKLVWGYYRTSSSQQWGLPIFLLFLGAKYHWTDCHHLIISLQIFDFLFYFKCFFLWGSILQTTCCLVVSSHMCHMLLFHFLLFANAIWWLLKKTKRLSLLNRKIFFFQPFMLLTSSLSDLRYKSSRKRNTNMSKCSRNAFLQGGPKHSLFCMKEKKKGRVYQG